MNCEKVRDKMMDTLAGTLSAEEKKKIKKHFKECDHCDEEMRVVESGEKHIRSFVESLGQDRNYLTPERLNKLQNQAGKPSKILSLRRVGSVAAAAAAIVVAIIYLPAVLSDPRPKEGKQSHGLARSTDTSELRRAKPNEDAPEWRVRYVGQKGQSDGDPAYAYTARAQELRMAPAWNDPGRASGESKDAAKQVYVPVGTNAYDSNQGEHWR